ncbi:MAG: alpha-2-macroglobulin family protein, partial [Candidatus Methylomirabilia bacterium]
SLLAAGTAEFLMAPNVTERIEFPVTVPSPQFTADGKLAHEDVVVRAAVERVADGARDAFEIRLPIRDDRKRVRLRTIEELAPGVAAAIAPLPEPARPGTIRRRLLVSDQPALVKMAAGLDFLMGYPYGCTEQRISEARAHLAFAKFRDVLALGDVAAASESAVRQALEWLPGVVDEGGLASYWPGGPGYVSLTAWAVRFAVEAKAAGHPVDQALLERMLRALEQALRSDYGRFVDGESFSERCQALGALAAAGRFNAAYAAELSRQAQFLNLEGTAEVLLAFTSPGGGASAGTTRELAKKLADGVATRLWQGREIYAGLREDWSGRNPLVLPDETAAIAVMAQALARANLEPARQKILVDALVALGRGDGWGTTRANAAALLGLAQYLAPPFAGSRPRKVAVRIGETRQTLSTDAAHPVGVYTAASGAAGEVLLSGGEPGTVALRTDTEYVPLADGAAVAPRAQGFAVSRELLRIHADGSPPERVALDAAGRTLSLAVGEVIEERVRIVNPSDRHFVAVVVPLAAGMEPLNPKLATAPPEAKPTGTITLAPTYGAYLDDQAAFYYDSLPKGTYEFAFRTRATVPGNFVQPPATAELMYDGAVRGNGAGARVEIWRAAVPLR